MGLPMCPSPMNPIFMGRGPVERPAIICAGRARPSAPGGARLEVPRGVLGAAGHVDADREAQATRDDVAEPRALADLRARVPERLAPAPRARGPDEADRDPSR